MSDLFGNPKDRFTRVAAYFTNSLLLNYFYFIGQLVQHTRYSVFRVHPKVNLALISMFNRSKIDIL